MFIFLVNSAPKTRGRGGIGTSPLDDCQAQRKRPAVDRSSQVPRPRQLVVDHTLPVDFDVAFEGASLVEGAFDPVIRFLVLLRCEEHVSAEKLDNAIVTIITKRLFADPWSLAARKHRVAKPTRKRTNGAAPPVQSGLVAARTDSSTGETKK